MISNAIKFRELSSFIYERAPNNKNIYCIVSRLRETRGSSDHVGKLQEKSQRNKETPPPEGKYFYKLKTGGRGVLKMSSAFLKELSFF